MCQHTTEAKDGQDRQYINAPEHGNCVLCLIEDQGPMTQKQIAQHMNLSQSTVDYLQNRAMQKIRKRNPEVFEILMEQSYCYSFPKAAKAFGDDRSLDLNSLVEIYKYHNTRKKFLWKDQKYK